MFIARNALSWWWLGIPVLIYSSILFLGAVMIRWNFYVPSLHHGDRSRPMIAISFDDGPASETAAILDILHAEQVPAAFFCIGNKVKAAPELVNRIVSEGHLIGNHSYFHGRNFDWKNRQEMLQEIQATNEAVFSICGKKMQCFRPPYGVTNPELSQAITLSNMQSIGWSLRSFDTRAKTDNGLNKRIQSQLQNGDIILLHDSMAISAGILTGLIRDCRKKGFTFARLDSLLGINAYA